MKQHVLLVEDEDAISEPLAEYLDREGFEIEVAATLEEASRALAERPPDLVLLDVMLPDGDGRDLCREIRKTSDVPILMLTARGEEIDKILGLELGADDYMVKPFSPRELVARVRAVLRRAEGRAGPAADVLRVMDLTLDLPRQRLTVGDRPIELTATVFQLLAALARQPGRFFTRSQLLDAVHGVAFESYERAIDTHIKNLRRKIEPDPHQPRYIQTVYGVGYRLAEA